ncbi:HAD-IA family hydrolase [Candidatus Roizmanbacteria bacterium]|nr:HAD-IA family hydrolase [Candidatus Roizmanbacteria bacterium]
MTNDKVKTIIFDFDGTIADTFPLILELFDEYAEEFGYKKIDRKESERLRNKNPKEIFQELKISPLKLPFLANKIRNGLNKQIQTVKIFPGMKDVLLSLKKKNFYLGILTSNSLDNVRKFLFIYNLEVFNFVHSEMNIFGKDKALNNMLRQNKLSREDVIYIGDEVRDIEACKKAKIKIIAVTWGFNKKEILQKNNPDYLIDKPEELLKIIIRSGF